MKLILNVLANIALAVIAIDFVRKSVRYMNVHHFFKFEQWGFILTSMLMGVCAVMNLILKSNPYYSEVFQNVCLAIFLYILLKTPKSIATILEDEPAKKHST